MLEFNYSDARQNILELSRLNFSLVSSPTILSQKGKDGEDLAVDFISKSIESEDLIVIISGTHGIEGVFGHLLQRKLLESQLYKTLPPDTGLVLVHALNPWGVSFGRRTDHNNVDVNRGCFDVRSQDNLAYNGWKNVVEPDRLDPLSLDCLRKTIGTPPDMSFWGRILREVISGQDHSPKGLFYGGKKLCWSGSVLKMFCTEHLFRAKRVVVIDIHSGLGPRGFGTIISTVPSKDGEDARRTESWFGDKVQYPNARAPSIVAAVQGDVLSAIKRWLLNTEVTGVGLEMGTISPAESFPSVIAENFLYHYPEKAKVLDQGFVRSELETFQKTFAPVKDGVWMDASWNSFVGLWNGATKGLVSRQ